MEQVSQCATGVGLVLTLPSRDRTPALPLGALWRAGLWEGTRARGRVRGGGLCSCFLDREVPQRSPHFQETHP